MRALKVSNAASSILARKLTKIGWRASSTCELHFDRCKIPAGNLLGTRGAGLRQTLSQISTFARVHEGAHRVRKADRWTWRRTRMPPA